MRRPSMPGVILIVPVVLLVTGVMLAFAQSAGSSYTVVQGDVLDLIAAEANVDLDCLIEANGLATPARIFPGDVLTIPADCPPYQGLSTPRGDFAPVAAVAAGQGGGVARQVQPGGGEAYTIQPGDTLDTVAQQFNVALDALLAANPDVFPPNIPVGTVITIPNNAPPYGGFPVLGAGQGGGGGVPAASAGERVYIAQPRDVLDLIAASLDVELACLIERNQLSFPPLIYPGQQIIIPANCGPYTGDSIAFTLRAPVLSPNQVPDFVEAPSAGASPAPTVTGGVAPFPTPTLDATGTVAIEIEGEAGAGGLPTPTPEFAAQDAFATPTLRPQGGGVDPVVTPEVSPLDQIDTSREIF